jgi:hypothetical protein
VRLEPEVGEMRETGMREATEFPEPGRDTFEDVVRDFLRGERELLEKERAGEPTTGERPATPNRFALIDQLLAEHERSRIEPGRFEQTLRAVATGEQRGQDGPDQQAQAAEMLERWTYYHQIEQPTAQRTPYEPSR